MKRIIMSLLLASATLVTPAYANYFANPALGISLNVGSAPNPTPNDIRQSREPVLVGQANAAPAKGAVVVSDVHKTHEAALSAASAR